MGDQQTISSNLKELELNALLEVTQAINNNLPEESLYKIYHFTLLANLNVKRLALFVFGEKWDLKVHFGVKESFVHSINPDQFNHLNQAVPFGKDDPASEVFEFVIPVLHKEKLLAVIYVGDVAPAEMGTSSKSSTTFLEALTNIILVAIENKKLARKQLEQEAYRKELEIAKQVQQYLVPDHLPKTNKLEIAAVYKPHHDIGGDYYDYIPMSENQFMVCIADVSGKGVPAALMMSNFQASLRTLVRRTNDLELIIRELNFQLKHSGHGEIFITFFVAIYDDLLKQLEYVNCGHNLPFIRFVNSTVKELSIGTTVLGMFNPLPFLEKGVIKDLSSFELFCYTDGLSEANNALEEEFGDKIILDIINSHQKISPESLCETIMSAVEDFRKGHPYRDDVTLLSMQVKGDA